MNTQSNMTEQALSNGLPPQFGKSNIMPSPVSFNGIESSNSSRTASPANRIQQIPASQLPPSRSIPSSQLPQKGAPPSANINQLAQKYSNLSVSQITPVSSPKIQTFSTSTPVATVKAEPVISQTKSTSNEFSPVATISTQNNLINQNSFTHSAQSCFTNVALTSNTMSQGKPDVKASQLDQKGNYNNNKGHHIESNSTSGLQAIGSTKALGEQVELANTRLPPQIGTMNNTIQPPKNIPSAVMPDKPLHWNDIPKIQQSLSQPVFNAQNLAKAPLPQPMSQNSQPNLQQEMLKHNFGSTPNLYQKPMQASQNVNAPVSVGQRPQFNTHLQQTIPQNIVNQVKQDNSANISQKSLQSPPHPNMMYSNVGQQESRQVSNVPQQIPMPQLPKTNLHANRYPTMQQYPSSGNMQYQNMPNPNQQPQPNVYSNQTKYDQPNQMTNMQQRQPINNYNLQSNYQQNYNSQANVVQSGFSKMWGHENYDLLQCPNILPPTRVEPPRITLGQDFLDAANCSPDIFRCTMTKIPETNTLLQKSRLPLGILVHPFKDLDHLPVIQCSTIVRCRACRTYINPFVFFVDMKRWKCNLCYRVNELPEEFQFDPVSKTYGDPSRRPEIKSSTIEYIAPSEYMLRPPQPAVYLFLLDVSHAAIESGYLHTFCNVLTTNLTTLPGDARTQVGFIAFNSALHFYSLADGFNQPHEMTVLDVDDVFLPCPDNLLVNLHERKDLICDLLNQLQVRFKDSYDTGCALGAALQAAHKMIASTGGRITVFQSSLPNIGPGALTVREDPSQRASAEVHHLNPANDFYKRLALECSGQQIAVDLFILNSQYVDLATISGISRFSGGCIYHFPLFKASRILNSEHLERTLKRYLTRKIGFEAVMRIRCTRGLSIHTFHGNFFVRSTDLLSLPNVNPEAGFGMQVSIDESLTDIHTVCFQAALLYTSSKGERRIRVHTLCVPIASTLPDIIAAADQQCIIGVLSKMAVDRSMQSSLSDAREAFINVAIDILSSYKLSLNLGNSATGLMAPHCLKLLPLYISALLKHVAFRSGTSTRLDDRVKAMCDMKTLPLYLLIQQIYPDLYPVHNLEDQNTTLNVEGETISQPPHLQLTARSLDSKGAFLMDLGEHMIIYVGSGVSQTFLNEALGVPDYASITDQMFNLPNIDTPHNQRLNSFINYLNDEKSFVATLHVIRENSPHRSTFIERLIEDRIETALSYHEFLQHLKTQVK